VLTGAQLARRAAEIEAHIGSATLGTNFEVRYPNNIARTAVVVARSLACPPGSRLFDGACHPYSRR
jgi:hypothetical protein